MLKEPNLDFYLPLSVGRTDVFMSFTRALAQKEMETAASRTWTLIAMSIS